MSLLNYDCVSIGDRVTVSLSGDHGMNARGTAGAVIDGYVTEKIADTKTLVLDSFLIGVNETDEMIEHVRVAQRFRDTQAIDQTGDV